MKKSKAGGARKGAGRPKGEPTIPISMRVPVKYKKQIAEIIRKEILRLSKSDL